MLASCLLPLVDDQRGPLTERLAAVRAHVRLLSGVHTFMKRQVTFFYEAFATRSAIKNHLTQYFFLQKVT